MKWHDGLMLLLMILVSTSCFAYEVVLKNGKILRGEVLSDNQELLVLLDSEGVQLKIRHEQIDTSKTQERNQKADVVQPRIEQTQPIVEKEKTITGKPTTKARVYTKQDLEKMPELSVIGTNETADEAAIQNRLKDQQTKEQQDEAAWNEEALRIDDEIQRAKESYEYNKSLCDKVIPDLTDLMDGPYVKMTAEQYEEQRRFACVESDIAAKDLKKAEAKYEQLLEKARKAGVPPGWVDPHRIRH